MAKFIYNCIKQQPRDDSWIVPGYGRNSSLFMNQINKKNNGSHITAKAASHSIAEKSEAKPVQEYESAATFSTAKRNGVVKKSDLYSSIWANLTL